MGQEAKNFRNHRGDPSSHVFQGTSSSKWLGGSEFGSSMMSSQIFENESHYIHTMETTHRREKKIWGFYLALENKRDFSLWVFTTTVRPVPNGSFYS